MVEWSIQRFRVFIPLWSLAGFVEFNNYNITVYYYNSTVEDIFTNFLAISMIM